MSAEIAYPFMRRQPTREEILYEQTLRTLHAQELAALLSLPIQERSRINGRIMHLMQEINHG